MNFTLFARVSLSAIFIILVSYYTPAHASPLQPLSVNTIHTRLQCDASHTTRTSTPAARTTPRNQTRQGPKVKPLEHRIYKPRDGPYRRKHVTYSKTKKIEVLKFMCFHLVPIDKKNPDGEYRSPSFREAEEWFKIPKSNINRWWNDREKILYMKTGRHRAQNQEWFCRWPRMEEDLFEHFIQKRLAGDIVRRGWFRRTAISLFRKHYSATNNSLTENLFVFSSGWFTSFQKRWGISCRAITKMASRLPEEYHQLILNWLRFNRRISQHPSSLMRENLLHTPDPSRPLGSRFRYSNTLNIDETPIPFEYLSGKTYDMVGSQTVSARTMRSGWDKRQATLILYLFADGKNHIKPKIIFSAETGDTIRRNEEHLYHSEVTVEFNKTAYNNESLFLRFIDEELVPTLDSLKSPSEESLLLLDSACFHKTDVVLKKLHDKKIATSLIPGGCTCYTYDVSS